MSFVPFGGNTCPRVYTLDSQGNCSITSKCRILRQPDGGLQAVVAENAGYPGVVGCFLNDSTCTGNPNVCLHTLPRNPPPTTIVFQQMTPPFYPFPYGQYGPMYNVYRPYYFQPPVSPTTTTTTINECPVEVKAMCNNQYAGNYNRGWCVPVVNGNPDARNFHEVVTQQKCFVGQPNTPGFDPCNVSTERSGSGYVPRSCMAQCCPGNFGMMM
jgi:hypothetical protein